jgi:hypothetical protein
MPIHPLVGQSVEVYRRVRARDGRMYVDVWHPDGRCIRLPVQWTDLALMPLVERPTSSSTLDALVALCLAVEVLRGATGIVGVDRRDPGGSQCTPEQATSRRRALSSPAKPADTLDDGSPHRGVGDARAPGADGDCGGEV